MEMHDTASTDTKLSTSNNKHGKEGLKSFSENTTLHGARFLFVENVFRRLFWTLALIACIGFCIFQVFTSLTAFYQRPFNTKISVKTSGENKEFPFPAVTLCNLNIFNKRRYRNFFKGFINLMLIEKKIQDISLMATKADEIFKPEFMNRNPELFTRLETATDTLNIQGNISHQIGEMLLPSSSQFNSCSINGIPCTEKNFTSHMSSAYGQCYTFNSGDRGHPLLHATFAGQNSGLKLRLNIERDSYIGSAMRPSVGLAIIIHDQKSFPFIEEFGIAIQPGISSLCSLRRRKIINLPSPYETNCTNRSLRLFRGDSDAYTYTKKACLIKCRNDYTIKRCGCSPPEFKAFFSADSPICAPNDTVLCVHASYEEFGTSSEKVSCEQNCPEPCEHVEFETSFSYNGIQTDTLSDYLLASLNDTENKPVNRMIYKPLLNMTKSEREKYVEKNIVSLDIYFEDLGYKVIEQTPLYEMWTIIGHVGGTFGLFVGLSLLTVLEFLDFIFRRICHVLREAQRLFKHSDHSRNGTIHAEF